LTRENDCRSEIELNLTISDIDDFDEPMPILFDLNERQTEDIAINELNSCCHKASSDKDMDANESTFISYLPEPDQSIDLIPFDQTFENMDAVMQESIINTTKHAF